MAYYVAMAILSNHTEIYSLVEKLDHGDIPYHHLSWALNMLMKRQLEPRRDDQRYLVLRYYGLTVLLWNNSV